MPVCRCSRQIQSGRRCGECLLEDMGGDGYQTASQEVQDDDPVLVECTACDERYRRQRGESCPHCGSDRRRFVGSVEDAGHPVPVVRTGQGPITSVAGPRPGDYLRADGGRDSAPTEEFDDDA